MVDACAWSVDSRMLATIDRSKVVSVWDLSYAYPAVAEDEGERLEILYPGMLRGKENALSPPRQR